MTLEEFVGQGWKDHAGDTEGVWRRMPEGIALADTSERILALANLAVHVAGEHLGRWDEGISFLERLAAVTPLDGSEREVGGVRRLQAVLEYCAGRPAAADRCLSEVPLDPSGHPHSSRVRMLAIAASALANHRRTTEASGAFDEALRLAGYGPDANDPAARALAITGNSLAVELENREILDEAETQLMLRAAQIGRKYWEVAGSWTEVERAEYRLAMSHLKARLLPQALLHALECLRVVRANGTDAGEIFFAHEAISRVRHAMGEAGAAHSERNLAAIAVPGIASLGFREYCAGELAKLDAILGTV